jgi:hypothetical protein
MAKRNGRRVSGDPRKSGGNISGPGGPNDANGVVIDTTDAVLLDYTEVALMGSLGLASPHLALLLEGRINKTSDRARNLYLMNEDGAAALVSELVALGFRIGPEFGDRLMERFLGLIDSGSVGGGRMRGDG